MKTHLKRLFSGALSVVMAISAIPAVSAHAEESDEPYPYTMFAGSDAEGAITVNAGNFCVIVTEDGITIDYPDSDGDGIVDLLEAILGTDPSKIDTDDDGLTDYQELNITGTDPTDYDSVEKRISDADADSDGDGVSNLEEIELGTDPLVLDSDDDGLTDGEETNTYLTDPLLEDTDGDGLTDCFEVRYGLDPLSPYTNGIADAEHKIEQTISADSPVLSEVNTSDSPYEMSVTITTNGDAERGLDVAESGYSVSLENDAQIGGITDLNLSDSCDPDSIRLTYAIKDAYRSNTLNKYSEFEDLQGIKRLCVFKYFDEISMMLPLDTQYDLENNTIYADVNDGGTYCVMDLEVWFDLFDLELDEIQIPVEVSEPQSNPPRQYLPRASADPVNKAPLDLVFILQTAGPVHMGNIYSDELSLMEEVSGFALTQYTDVRIYVIDYKYDSANIIKFGSRDYCTNVSALTNKIRNLEYTALNVHDYCDTRIPFNLLKTELKLRKGVNSYIYHLHNGSNEFTWPTEDGISICNSDLGIFSQIVQVNTVYSSEEYKLALAKAIDNNHGLNIEYDETTVSEIMDHIRNNIDLSKTRTEYDALIATSLTKITLDDKLSPNNHVDTDEDTIYDWDEADNRYINVNADGSVSLPTIQDLLSHINIADVFNIPATAGYARNAMFNAIRNREVLPCKTDPTLKDSDGDGLKDNEDIEPTRIFLYDLVQYLNKMERYVNDFIPMYCYIYKIGLSDAPQSSTVIINVLRNYEYGTDEYDFFEHPIMDMAKSFTWNVTDGTNYPEFRNYINGVDPTLLSHLKKYRLHDKDGQEVDFLHLLATLGAGRYNFIIDPNLAGWAGDLQTLIRDIRLAAGSEGYDSNDLSSNVYKLITGELIVHKPKFPMSDLLADVDAKNLKELYDESCSLSQALKNYYTNYTDNRFTRFVSECGGFDTLYSLANSYTRGNHPVKHLILKHYAGDNEVTEAESNAIRDGFIQLIEDKVDEEA